MHSILQDVRYGLRMLTKNPGMTLAAILTLGLGIGANTATFSLSNTFLRKPVSFPEVERGNPFFRRLNRVRIDRHEPHGCRRAFPGAGLPRHARFLRRTRHSRR